MWLLQWLVQGVTVAVAATLAVRLVPSASPRLRHLLWWLALAAVLALPWLPGLMTLPAAVTTLASPPPALALEVTAPPAWLWTACLTLWAGTTLLGLVALLADLRALRALKQSARPLRWRHSNGVPAQNVASIAPRRAQVSVSDDLAGACAVGFFAPRVIVSSGLASTLEPEALAAIVRHELAHLERFDDWLRLLQRLVLAAAGLHPAVRWISRQIDIEREAACDRRVVDQTGDPRRYALALTTVAELTAGARRGAPLVAPGAVVAGAGLHSRMVRVLGGQTAPSPRRIRAAAVASTAMLLLAVTGAAAMPPLVAFVALEPSLRALASLPAGRAFVPRVPALRARPVPVSGLEGAPVVSRRLEEPGRITPLASPPADENPVALEAEAPHVAAETLEVPARREVRIDAPVPLAAAPAIADAIGNRASRVGSVTGSRAARAGSALGRFFSKGGQAVADRF